MRAIKGAIPVNINPLINADESSIMINTAEKKKRVQGLFATGSEYVVQRNALLFSRYRGKRAE